MKRVLSLVLALSMVMSMFTFAFAGTSLKDVAGTEYEAAVEALVELGIVSGYTDGTYLPNKAVSRAEMAKLLVIAAGLEPAAKVAVGATKFSDVSADHWACGYINVAAEYGYISGYPDGTFKPDETVSYAEAVTMALRVLGYKSVVEAKGTWPTNYIAKAQDLEMLEDIDYTSYGDGATRGNVALLMWNMLTTNMWDVDSENETNGITYKEKEEMINLKFPDYKYYDEDLALVVTDIEVEDGKVTITVDSEEEDAEDVCGEYELAQDTDFLRLFGRTVSILYNTEDEVAVMVSPSSEDKVIEGLVIDLSDDMFGDYDFDECDDVLAWGTDGSAWGEYVSAVVGSHKTVESATVFGGETGLVDTVKTKKGDTTVKFSYGDLDTVTLDEDAIVLIDGKWATAEDIEAGAVLTELVEDELYALSTETVTGSFDDVEFEYSKDEYTYSITVDGTKYEYPIILEVVEIDEDGEDIAETDIEEIMEADKDADEYKFYDEDATLYFNFLGQVVRIEFNEVEDLEKVGHFYVLTNCNPTWDVSDKSGVTTYVELNGESYEVKSGVEVDLDEDDAGEVVYVKFDSKDRVKELTLVSEDLEEAIDEIEDEFIIDSISGEDGVLDDNNYIGDTKVTSSTVVFTIKPVYDEEDDEIVDHYEVETSKGTSALKGVEAVVAAMDADEEFNKLSYVFVWDDAMSDEMFGIIEKISYSKGAYYLVIDGTKYEVDEDTVDEYDFDIDEVVGALVSFVETSDETIIVKRAYLAEELDNAAVVTKVEDEMATLDESTVIDLDVIKDNIDDDCRIFFLEVSEDEDDEDEYVFDSVEEISAEDIKLKKNDRIAVDPNTVTDMDDIDDAEIILIIRGMEAAN